MSEASLCPVCKEPMNTEFDDVLICQTSDCAIYELDPETWLAINKILAAARAEGYEQARGQSLEKVQAAIEHNRACPSDSREYADGCLGAVRYNIQNVQPDGGAKPGPQ